MLGKSQNNPFSILRVFLQRFVFLSTNNLLHQSEFNEVCEWIMDKCGIDILISLCRLGSPSMKVFARRAFCSAVQSGNIRLAKRLFQCEAQLQDEIPQSQRWAEYLSDAVSRGHEDMVELLCKAGVPPKIKHRWSWLPSRSDWESRLPILRTFLAFGADPETFITEEKPGFPLIDAARDGSLQAVKLLVQAGARVDLYLSQCCGTALQAAASRGHLEVAKYLIHSGADCNVPNVQHLRRHGLPNFHSDPPMIALQTPVQLAAKMNDISLLQVLLEHGASAMAAPVSIPPDLESDCYRRACATTRFNYDAHRSRMLKPHYDYGRWPVYTALQYGVLSQNLNLVALLLSTGVDPDSRVAPGVGDTPLQMSARLSNFEIFQLLLSSGADVNAPPTAVNGRTAVQGAAESGNWEMLSMLQSAGAQINAPAGEVAGLTALQAACLNGHSLMVGFLLAHQANLNAAASVAGLTPIQAAATYGDIGLVRDLISLGADIDAPATETGTTALLAATKHKSLPLLEILVKNGADVNLTSGYELKSPLREAACGDWLEGVEFLLKHGANVNDTRFETATSDEFGDELYSPLGWAISNRSEEMVGLLLQQGADVLATVVLDGIDSKSALICALSLGSSIDLINLLFAKVEDLESHPGWEDALNLAFGGFYDVDFDLCEMIIEKTSSMPPHLRYKLLQNGWNALYTFYMDENEGIFLEAVDFLIKAGADVNHRDEDRSTLLQRMASLGYYESCCFLVGHGAAVNTPAPQQYGTPLQQAVKNREVKVAEFLLEHGADVNALPADDRGVTALQAASINGMLGIAVQLLERGADVSALAAPKDGRTAIDAAAEHGHLDMVQLLLNAYGEQEDLGLICNQAADYAEKEGHHEIAQWLRGYSP